MRVIGIVLSAWRKGKAILDRHSFKRRCEGLDIGTTSELHLKHR